MSCWLFKTEPSEFSIQDLAAAALQTTRWDGIRNYQARNHLRDNCNIGDRVLVYHSSCRPTAVVGTANVVSAPYPDPSQFDQNSPYFDSKAVSEKPRWISVDIQFNSIFANPVTLEEIKANPALKNLILLKNTRLSIQPVGDDEYDLIVKLGSD